MNVQENIGVTISSSLLWVNIDGSLESYYPSSHDPVDSDTVFSSLSIEPPNDQQDEPMATTDTPETVQQPVAVQSQDPSTPSQVPQDPRLPGVTPSNTPIAFQYSNTLLMEAMASSQDRDRDRQRGGRPRKPTLEDNDISDPVRILKFIDRFILYARTKRTIEERYINESDPTQIRLAGEVSELRRQLEERSRPPATPQSISRENRNLPLDQRYNNPLHVIWEQIEPTKVPGTSLFNRKCRPISFVSRLLTNSQQNWPTVQKVLYAIFLMLTESGFENYLKGRRLIIFTDHQNLTYMLTAPNKNRIVRRWLPIFSEFLFDIVHTKGEENHWADMLSRIVPPQDNHTINHLVHSNDQEFHLIYYTNRIDETESERCFVEDLHTFEKVLILQDKCSNDLPLFEPWLCKIRSEQKRALANQDTSLNNCTLDSRLDLYLTPEHKIVIPQSLVKDTLNLLHGLPQGGHPSKAESLLRLKNSDYWWPIMLFDMTKHVQEYPSCQKTAAVPKLHVPTTGSLWADRPFARVNVDVIGPLPEDQDGHRYILVFVDSFTRFTIIVPLKEFNANLTADALIWKFSKAVFDALCEFLGIEVSKSVPHFSESNGLVERRHRDILQNLRKLLVDFNAYDAWSEYIPYVQLLINSSKSSITDYSPYELMFGSNFSPRADPGKIIKTLESSKSESTYINDIQSKFARLKKKQEEAELCQASKAPPRDSQIEANPFSPGQLVKRATSSTAKLHGNYKGPFLVIDTPSTSTVDKKKLCTGIVVKASVKHLQPWHSSLPADDEFHSWVAAGDAEEHVIQKVLSQDGDYWQVQWPGNHITTELVSTVQNTSAYKEFSKSISNTRSRPSRCKRRSDNINNNVNPTPIRPRRSKRRKGSVSLG
ncbi:hypothetical protein P9112_005664 [Eukaryota sp. TZLM1-RC]